MNAIGATLINGGTNWLLDLSPRSGPAGTAFGVGYFFFFFFSGFDPVTAVLLRLWSARMS